MLKIIFLDFDGVLIPSTFSKFLKYMERLSNGGLASKDDFGQYFYEPCVQNLKTLGEKSCAKIVFSTNWRNEHEQSKFLELFKKRIDISVLGSTPTIDPKLGNRGNEIEAFLAKLENYEIDYVILDDMAPTHFLAKQLPFLVNCDEKFGFTKINLEKALAILNKPSFT
jgi:hypothetical protein